MLEISSHFIKLTLEQTYSINSFDNSKSYNEVIFGTHCTPQNAIEFIGVNNMKTGKSLLLIASGSPKGLNEYSYLVHANTLLICVGNSVFSICLTTFSLKWTLVCDSSCCFGLLKMKNQFLIHGELELTAVNVNGSVLWKFYGKDIFVSHDDHDVLSVLEDKIIARDWSGNTYVLDFNGNRLPL